MVNYCCERKCFSEPPDQVDGIACRDCKALSYCHCKCLSFTDMKIAKNMSAISNNTKEIGCDRRCDNLKSNANPDNYCDVCLAAVYLISNEEWPYRREACVRLRRSRTVSFSVKKKLGIY